ncbi:MAG: aminopeptidase family protein [Propionibacteriaceae bacterium]|nr:aminopeptidase family protein [Propionibacteriaceae bacterium]
MTTTNPPTPAAFTKDDFAARMSRVASSAAEKGLAGVIVTPGPDLAWSGSPGTVLPRSLSG